MNLSSPTDPARPSTLPYDANGNVIPAGSLSRGAGGELRAFRGDILATVLFACAVVVVAANARQRRRRRRRWAPVQLGDLSRRRRPHALLDADRDYEGQRRQAASRWTYDTGDRGEYQANNLIVDGVLFTASPTRKVIALNAATGKEIWKFDATTERPGAGGGRQRGRGLLGDAQGGERGSSLASATTSTLSTRRPAQLIRSFGENGALHLAPVLSSTAASASTSR